MTQQNNYQKNLVTAKQFLIDEANKEEKRKHDEYMARIKKTEKQLDCALEEIQYLTRVECIQLQRNLEEMPDTPGLLMLIDLLTEVLNENKQPSTT